MGLRSAPRTSKAAYWASWADCLAMINERHPEVAQLMVDELEGLPRTSSAARKLTGAILNLFRSTLWHKESDQHPAKLDLAKVGFGQSRFWPKSVMTEVGGRWSQEMHFVSQLARAIARGETNLMRRRAEQAWRLKWIEPNSHQLLTNFRYPTDSVCLTHPTW